jgi:hypothetical protein
MLFNRLLYKTTSENTNADAVISNICILKMRLSLLDSRIRAMRLLSASVRLLQLLSAIRI